MNRYSMENPSPVTAAIINFRTPDLTLRAVNSFQRYYPDVPLLLVDNASNDGSLRVLEEIRQQNPRNTDMIVNDHNLHHGPAMDQALRYLRSQYVFFLDSDAEVLKGNFLEGMVNAAEQDPGHYAVGHRVKMNKRGFDVSPDEEGFPYIRPYCMLIKRELYLLLPRFQLHGTPCLENMQCAARRGLALVAFPVDDYISHQGRGTAARFGYQLGMRGKINYIMNKFGW